MISDTFCDEATTWALRPYVNGQTFKSVSTENRLLAKKTEDEWGNRMIQQGKNGNWTTRLGEQLVREHLERLGENPRRPSKKNGYQPDWETDSYIYEVKTRTWCTTGTAGEKVLGAMYKYSDIPKLYGKPLKIVCVAYQEYELTYGNTKIFGDVGDTKGRILELAKEFGIEYVPFSELANK